MICIADVHIRPGRREDSVRFISWLEKARSRGKRIYILGDLFDYWFKGVEKELGDVLAALASPQVFVIPGNRDFLLSRASAPGITLLGEEAVVSSPTSQKLLLAHGHTLTGQDFGFKLLHAVGWPLLRLLDRVLSPSVKERIARSMVSSSAVIRPPRADIDPGLAARKNVDMIVCGHLHRMQVSERVIVLPPFFDTGQWLVWDQSGFRFEG
jgi:UDP-2,3-diacylglucosamine pyrophosphatase LpxH